MLATATIGALFGLVQQERPLWKPFLGCTVIGFFLGSLPAMIYHHGMTVKLTQRIHKWMARNTKNMGTREYYR